MKRRVEKLVNEYCMKNVCIRNFIALYKRARAADIEDGVEFVATPEQRAAYDTYCLVDAVKNSKSKTTIMRPEPARAVHSAINWRVEVQQTLNDCTDPDTGLVTVEESGMDCDGTQYSGRAHTIKPHWWALRKLGDEINEWADGPFSLRIVRLDLVPLLKYESRDRALEAFENGHPHSIHY